MLGRFSYTVLAVLLAILLLAIASVVLPKDVGAQASTQSVLASVEACIGDDV
jgi:hypothetical protein